MNIQEWKQQGKPFNVILHGDCMDLMAELGENEIDLAVVDPPYGLERFKHGGSVINRYGSETQQWNNVKPSQQYFDELFRVSKSQIIWGGNNFTLPESEYFIIWDKVNPENFSFAMCEMAWTNCKKPAKIFRLNSMSESKERIHPTQKPVALYRWILQNYAKPGQTIIDTHSGSGSLACACHLEKFNFIAIEKDYDYWLASVKRYEELKSQGVLF